MINIRKTNGKCYISILIDALLNQALVLPTATCPPNSALITNRCQCNVTFRASNDLHECGKQWSQIRTLYRSILFILVHVEPRLVQYTGSPIVSTANLTTEECEVKFQAPVEVYDNGVCQCKNGSVLNTNKTGCCKYNIKKI
jgi:hypothetical protein